MTKAELIAALEKKVMRAKPIVRREFSKLLRSRTKPQLERMLKTVRVSRDGYDIRT